MAKVTFHIQDMPNGTVQFESDPSFETLARKLEFGVEPSAAEAYALMCIRVIREEGKKPGPIKVQVPRIGRQ